MVPHCAEGGNSLLLRAISSQNKNISFRTKSQINTGFYLTKKCFFLTHFMCWMKDVSKQWVKWVSGMHIHTSNFTPSLVFPSFSLFVSVSHTMQHISVHIQNIHRSFCFPHIPGIKGDSESHSWLWTGLVWRHHIVVSSFHINGVFTSFDKPNQDAWTT